MMGYVNPQSNLKKIPPIHDTRYTQIKCCVFPKYVAIIRLDMERSGILWGR